MCESVQCFKGDLRLFTLEANICLSGFRYNRPPFFFLIVRSDNLCDFLLQIRQRDVKVSSSNTDLVIEFGIKLQF